jgi:hypothetical protein
MGLGLRIFFVNDDDSLQRLSLAKFERLRRRDPGERLSQYAGKRVRYALVVLETVNRKPVEINLVQYSYLPFDSQGRIDAAEREKQASLAGEMAAPAHMEQHPGQVIDARHRFAKRRYDDHYSWTPSPEIESAIVEAIFGKDLR